MVCKIDVLQKKLAWLIRLLVTFVGTRNLNKLTDMCKFKSSQKIKADPSADSSKAFSVNREVSIVDIRFSFSELMPAV